MLGAVLALAATRNLRLTALAVMPLAGIGMSLAPALGRHFAGWTPRAPRVLALALAGAWALGALAGLLNLVTSVVRVRALRRRSSPLDGKLADELPWLTETARVSTPAI